MLASQTDWGKTSREDLIKNGSNAMYVYCGTKILAEQAAWKFKEEHPDIDLATGRPVLLPCCLQLTLVLF